MSDHVTWFVCSSSKSVGPSYHPMVGSSTIIAHFTFWRLGSLVWATICIVYRVKMEERGWRTVETMWTPAVLFSPFPPENAKYSFLTHCYCDQEFNWKSSDREGAIQKGTVNRHYFLLSHIGRYLEKGEIIKKKEMDGSEFNNHLQFTPFISIINYLFSWLAIIWPWGVF